MIEEFLAKIIAGREQLILPLLDVPSLGSAPDQLGPAISRPLSVVLARGVADGSVRPDATDLDVIIAGAMLARALLNQDWDLAATRMAALITDGLRRRDDQTTLPPSLTRSELDDRLAKP